MLSFRIYRVPLLLAVALFAACQAGNPPPAVAPAAVSSAPPATRSAVITGTTAGEIARATPLPYPAQPLETASPEATFTAAPQPTATVTATATATATQAPTATMAPTATITATVPVSPTATIPSAERLARGRSLQAVGDCEGARRELAALIAEAGTRSGPEISEARYRLGQCYLQDGAATEAGTVFAELLASAGQNDSYRAPATFMLGEAQAALEAWNEAESSYTKHLTLAPELASFTWQRIAAVRKGAGNLLGAIQAYSNALAGSPDWANTVAIRRALAEVLIQVRDGRGAAAQFDLLRGDQSTGAWAAEMQWLAGSALMRVNDVAGAAERWQAAAAADPKSDFAHHAVVALLDADVPVDEFQRGLVNYYFGNYQLAIDAFERLRKADPAGHNGEAWYYSGLSYLALDQYDSALQELGNFVAAYPNSPLWNDAWLAKARTQAYAGDTGGAIATYRQFAQEHPGAAQAPAAMWQAANLQAASATLEDATQAYLAMARRYPQANEAWQAYMAAGLAYYRAGDYRHAGEVWAEMAENTQMDAWTRPVAYYWLGKAQTMAGEGEAALHSWQAAANSGPDSYYGSRAAARVAGAGLSLFPQPSVRFPSEANSAVDTGALATWLRTWAGEGSLSLTPALSADPDWQRGRGLLDIGLRTSGVAAWTRLQKRFANDPWAQAALALAFRDAGENNLSITAAEQVAGLAPAAASQKIPVALERLIYPLPFSDLIREQSQRWGVDPLLVASVIRQESRFDTGAKSSAVAQGLMQVIPMTADWIAGQLGWSGFTPDQIYRPYVNVEFGTYYLRRQLDAFENSAATALAAYNGGPGNAQTWRSRAPGDEDLMVAQINLSESRLYVQLVWQNYDNYRRLYPR